MPGLDADVELADTSVWARIGRPGMTWFAAAVEDGRIATCDQVAMKVLFSARDAADFRATEEGLLALSRGGIEPKVSPQSTWLPT